MKPDGNQAVLLQVAPDRPGDDDEHDGRDQPQHQDVLGHREVDAEDRRQMDQRMVDAAVRDVLDDHLAGVEFLGGSVRGLGVLRRRVPEAVLDQHRVIRPRTGGAAIQRLGQVQADEVTREARRRTAPAAATHPQHHRHVRAEEHHLARERRDHHRRSALADRAGRSARSAPTTRTPRAADRASRAAPRPHRPRRQRRSPAQPTPALAATIQRDRLHLCQTVFASSYNPTTTRAAARRAETRATCRASESMRVADAAEQR